MSRATYWSFTINNYDEEAVGHLLTLDASKWSVVFGKEVAPTTGTPHLQGCIWSFDEDKRVWRKAVEKALGGHAWLEPTHNVWACVGYSIKEGDFYTNMHDGTQLSKLRDSIKYALEFGKEYDWLGSVFFNEDDLDQIELGRKLYEWQHYKKIEVEN